MKNILALSFILINIIIISLPVFAQNDQVIADYSETLQESRIGRAQNIARQLAEKTNGGLGKYRAEPSMFGDPRRSPYRDNGDRSWTFTFFGGTPGSNNFTVETVVTISENFSIIRLDYNGAIRSKSNH